MACFWLKNWQVLWALSEVGQGCMVLYYSLVHLSQPGCGSNQAHFFLSFYPSTPPAATVAATADEKPKQRWITLSSSPNSWGQARPCKWSLELLGCYEVLLFAVLPWNIIVRSCLLLMNENCFLCSLLFFLCYLLINLYLIVWLTSVKEPFPLWLLDFVPQVCAAMMMSMGNALILFFFVDMLLFFILCGYLWPHHLCVADSYMGSWRWKLCLVLPRSDLWSFETRVLQAQGQLSSAGVCGCVEWKFEGFVNGCIEFVIGQTVLPVWVILFFVCGLLTLFI